ncbi:3-oxoacyl-ACP synthase III family protein [Parapedobacter koreensis]|uniref:3-oxoacyl-[acyl-carrier-protein] synthase-3 n=1 Tax=Parapedobacter koreensis TaxID=332977 RepID=A0A1H7LBR2_9SPHI|nr:ketoacyl-ACP synthase III [Parapedobacter koreensis]SEK96318.1 3-oxoacyl-[acyl-carrier-protein] synthase-3 [Parapedobacter koreensis]
MKYKKSIIIGSGSYLPTRKVTNEDFMGHVFFDQDRVRLPNKNEDIINKFEQITGIRERRYVTDDLVASDIAFFAAEKALISSNTDRETLDYIIVAHNFGDIREDNPRSEFVPALASRVKHRLGIANPKTVTYDLSFGCAGWLQGVIQADYYIRSGQAANVMIIGAETLSRICDPHDRDSMIYADGAGAIILSAVETTERVGILEHEAQSYTNELAFVLEMGKSNNPGYSGDRLFLKMQGRKLYEQALRIVPAIIKECMDKAQLSIDEVDNVLIHQANNKMDEAILRELYGLYGRKYAPAGIMPMTISWLGNSSVATLPTLYNLLVSEKIEGYTLKKGSIVVFAAVGAGVNINALVYRVPD